MFYSKACYKIALYCATTFQLDEIIKNNKRRMWILFKRIIFKKHVIAWLKSVYLHRSYIIVFCCLVKKCEIFYSMF